MCVVTDSKHPSPPAQAETILLLGSDNQIRTQVRDACSLAGYQVLEAISRQNAEIVMSKFERRLDLIIGCVSSDVEALEVENWHSLHASIPLLTLRTGRCETQFLAMEAPLRARLAIEAARPSRSILVVSENEPERKVIASLLDAAGYRVQQARNGKGALTLLARDRCELLLTEVFMSEMDGLELIQSVRKSYPDIAMIAMSKGQYLTIARLLGANGTLQQPIEVDTLLRTVRHVADLCCRASTKHA